MVSTETNDAYTMQVVGSNLHLGLLLLSVLFLLRLTVTITNPRLLYLTGCPRAVVLEPG